MNCYLCTSILLVLYGNKRKREKGNASKIRQLIYPLSLLLGTWQNVGPGNKCTATDTATADPVAFIIGNIPYLISVAKKGHCSLMLSIALRKIYSALITSCLCGLMMDSTMQRKRWIMKDGRKRFLSSD